LKFNQPFTNAFCITLEHAKKYGIDSKRNHRNSNISNKRYDEYVELPLNSDYIITGIDSSVDYIFNTIRNKYGGI